MVTKHSNPSSSDLLSDIIVFVENYQGEYDLLNTELIPIGFFEADSNKIIPSFKGLEINSKTKFCSIQSKKQSDQYQHLYQLYHDLVIAFASTISKLPVGSESYVEADEMFKNIVQLIIRESKNRDTDSSQIYNVLPDSHQSDLEAQFSNEFSKISASFQVNNSEVVIFKSKVPSSAESTIAQTPGIHPGFPQVSQTSHHVTQPLFTSLTKKSFYDLRETVVPNPYFVSKVVPLTGDRVSSNSTIGTLCPQPVKIPSPTAPPTDILTNFIHPNWYTVQVPSWLTYKKKMFRPLVASSLLKSHSEDELRLISRPSSTANSFAPVTDSKLCVVSSELKGDIWLNHVGFKKFEESRGNFSSSASDKIPSNVEKELNDETEPQNAYSNSKMSDVDEFKADENVEINIQHLVTWDPEKIEVLESLKKDRSDIVTSHLRLQKLIASNILKLNKLRQERYLKSNPSNLNNPSKAEIHLYLKVERLLSITLGNHVDLSKLDFKPSSKLPVLMREFNGTLPGMAPSKASGYLNKSARLPSIRGPYKKKNRQL